MSRLSKNQKTLFTYFQSYKNDGTPVNIKRYFYLKWTDKYVPTTEAQWLDECPSDVNFIEEVKWNQVRKNHTFYLCGNFPDLQEKKFFLPHETKYKNVHNLKSHFQKNIRKQDDNLALSSAVHILKLDAVDLLRRLPIIMIEDAKMHKSFTTLMWLLVAVSSTEFKMKKYMYEYILGVIYILTKINNKDIIQYSQDANKSKLIDDIQEYNKLNNTECSYLYSLNLRVAYGGMNCDMEMFEQYAKVWYDRFSTNSNIKVDDTEVRPISFFSVKELELDEWDLSAIDFHCHANFCDLIIKKYPDLDIEEIKKMIWTNSSSINTRIRNHVIYNPTEWNQIKAHVQKTQRYLLDKSY